MKHEIESMHVHVKCVGYRAMFIQGSSPITVGLSEFSRPGQRYPVMMDVGRPRDMQRYPVSGVVTRAMSIQ